MIGRTCSYVAMPSSNTHAIIPLRVNNILNAALHQRNGNLISLQEVDCVCLGEGGGGGGMYTGFDRERIMKPCTLQTPTKPFKHVNMSPFSFLPIVIIVVTR